MADTRGRLAAPDWLTVGGSAFFILALAVAAGFAPDIRWLHVFQAMMYVATIWLAARHSRWGHYIGISAGGLWVYLFLFASPLFADWLRNLTRPDLLLQGLAGVANALVVIGCALAWARRSDRRPADAAWFAATFAITTGYTAAIIAIFSPERLAIFPALLHPHWPWARA